MLKTDCVVCVQTDVTMVPPLPLAQTYIDWVNYIIDRCDEVLANVRPARNEIEHMPNRQCNAWLVANMTGQTEGCK